MTDLPELKEQALLFAVHRDIISHHREIPRQVEISSYLKSLLADMDGETRKHLILQEQCRECAQPFFVDAMPYYLRAVNRLIRWYSVLSDDFFVEEIGLHQLGSTRSQGILKTVVVDGVQFDQTTHVSKVPPLATTVWKDPPPQLDATLADRLRLPDDPDFADVLMMRAKNLLERMALRNAIAEAAASLEVAVERAIRKAMAIKGKTATEIDHELEATEVKFPHRAEKTLKAWSGKGIHELDRVVWNQLKADRRSTRNKVVHSDREPTQVEAEEVVGRYIKMTTLVRKLY